MTKFLYVNDVIFSLGSGELTHTVGLLNALHRKGESIEFLTRVENLEILARAGLSPDVELDVSRMGRSKVAKRVFYYLKVYVKNIRGKDFIYVRESFYSFLILPLALMAPGKFILEFNGVRSFEVRRGFLKTVISCFNFLNKLLYRVVLTNVAVSEGVNRYLKDSWGNGRVVTINNGTALTSMADYKDISRTVGRRLVFVGNLASWQNFDFLIDLVKDNLDYFDVNDIFFDIYGGGPERKRLERRVLNAGLSGVVRFKGILSKSRIAEVLSNSAAGVLVDDRFYEGWPLFSPLKMYEYNQFNIPTILFSDVEAEPLQNKGFFVVGNSNLSSLKAIIDGSYDLSDLCRTWDDVASDLVFKVIRSS